MMLLPVSRLHDSLFQRLEMNEKDNKQLQILQRFVLFAVIQCVKNRTFSQHFSPYVPEYF